MIDDKDNKAEPAGQKPVAQAAPGPAEPPNKPQVEKLKLVTTEEARLAAEIEKLRR